MGFHQLQLIPMKKKYRIGQKTGILSKILAKKFGFLKIGLNYMKLGVYQYLQPLEKLNMLLV